MPVSIDLSKAHRSRPYGDIMAVWSWINDGRALFLIPHRRRGAPWFIVLERAAHEWDDRDPNMLMQVIARAVKACDVLGLTPTPETARRIIRIVNDAIPELAAMPSSPPAEMKRGSWGDLTLRIDGQAVNSVPMQDAVEGATYG